jgi:glycosyltransferase involved in cell wall biosynthesis
MRIAIDGRAFDAPAGGVRRYVNELFAAMRTVAPSTGLLAIGGSGVPPGIEHRRAAPSLPTNLGWCLSGLPMAARRERFDVFHAPAYTAPLWGVGPLVLTIHDVSYARRPDWSPHPRGVGAARQWFYRASAQRATRVITDSSFSRTEIIAAYAIDDDRIDVVPLGVNRAFRPDPSTARERCVLHVGDLHIRRNLEMLLDVVMELARQDARLSGLRLVLAGRDLGVLESLRARAVAGGAPDRLHYIGQPTDEELVRWYQRAGVLAYPSRYEGFGLPVLEALASGTPVVASNAASVPEVAGDAAILLPPDDPRQWLDALRSVLVDPSRARELTDRAVARAGRFTWEHTAELTIAAYTRAAAAVSVTGIGR